MTVLVSADPEDASQRTREIRADRHLMLVVLVPALGEVLEQSALDVAVLRPMRLRQVVVFMRLQRAAETALDAVRSHLQKGWMDERL